MMKQWWEKLETRPVQRDRAIALAWFVLGIILLILGLSPLWAGLTVFQGGQVVFYFTLGAIAAVATLRSKYPAAALLMGLGIFAVDVCLGASPGVLLILLDLVYALVKYGSGRSVQAALRGFVILAVGLAVAFLGRSETTSQYFDPAVQVYLLAVISASWGWNVRSERERTRLSMNSEHATATRDLQTQIAYDLHDLVANQIAVAGLHIEAAKLQAATKDFQGLDKSLDQAKKGTDQGHLELRNLITLLTAVDQMDHCGSLDVPAEVAQLSAALPGGRNLLWEAESLDLLGQVTAAKPDAWGHVVLRVLQELIANAVKHGESNTAINVNTTNLAGIHGDPPTPTNALVITLSNQVRNGGSALGSGIGIIGVRTLLSRIGGTLEAAPTDGTWNATVSVPLSASKEPL